MKKHQEDEEKKSEAEKRSQQQVPKTPEIRQLPVSTSQNIPAQVFKFSFKFAVFFIITQQAVTFSRNQDCAESFTVNY